MQTIYKFPLQYLENQAVPMLEPAEILSVGTDPAGVLCVWAKVDPNGANRTKRIAVVGTGHALPNGGKGFRFLGTVNQGPLMWHVLEDTREP